MPTNAKKIKIGGVSHDIEDTQARSDISALRSVLTGNSEKIVTAWEYGTINASGENALNDRQYYARTVGYYTPENDEVLNVVFKANTDDTYVFVEFNADNSLSKRVVIHFGVASEAAQMGRMILSKNKKYRFAYHAPSTVTIDLTNMQNYIDLFILSNFRKVYFVESTQGITGFVSTLNEAYNAKNADVYIENGTYTFTNAVVDGIRANGKRGVPIGNGCRYYFDQGCKVVCEYTGDNASDVNQYFSPLDSQSVAGDYEIHNLNLTAKNVLYALHDEANGSVMPYKRIYKNCHITLDNTAVGAGGNALSKCIGGGLGKYGEIVIENCVFDGTNPAIETASIFEVSYHGANNSAFTDSKISVTGSYFKNGTFGTSNVSANVSAPYPEVLFSNNSYKTAISKASNWTIMDWNNSTH